MGSFFMPKIRAPNFPKTRTGLFLCRTADMDGKKMPEPITPTPAPTAPAGDPAPTTPAAPAGPATPAPPAAQPAQDDPTDWKAEARKWEQRSKDNKTALDDLTGKHAEQETKITELTGKVTAFESKTERAALLEKVATAAGVPAEALRGADEAELTAHAETLKALIVPSAPVIDGQGKTPGTPPDDPNRKAVRSLFGKNAN